MFYTLLIDIVFLWFISCMINLAVIMVINRDPFALDRFVLSLVEKRSYLGWDKREGIGILMRVGGYFAWAFLLYVFLRDYWERLKQPK